MANGRQASAKRMKMAERAQQQMDVHFPNFHPAWIWTRKTNDGFFTVPRTMPVVMQTIDAQTKGQPAGHTLLCLWARAPDHPVITIENPATFAAEAGFIESVPSIRGGNGCGNCEIFCSSKPNRAPLVSSTMFYWSTRMLPLNG